MISNKIVSITIHDILTQKIILTNNLQTKYCSNFQIS